MKIRQANLPLAILFALVFALPGFGQKKVLARPEILARPLDYAGPQFDQMINEGSRKKNDDNIAWLVVSDRDENPVFDRPNGSPKERKLAFRDCFFVVDEEKDWIKIVKATIHENLKIEELQEDIGWVPKKNMLLWTSGLLHPTSKIHQKAFLLNRADAADKILRENREIARIYRGPNTEKEEEPLKIYSFYFILKKEFGKYLLCREDQFSRRSVLDIVGWVRQDRCADWNTRICLEPSFDPEGFSERKNRPELRVKAFKDRFNAESHFSAGKFDQASVFWDNDPAKLLERQLSKANPRRFNGGVIRFPVLASGDVDATYKNVFRSGVIGRVVVKVDDQNNRIVQTTSIDEPDMATIKRYGEEEKSKAKRVNVFLSIEYSPAMQPYQAALPNLIDNLKAFYEKEECELKIGALLYRDASFNADKVYVRPLSHDYEGLKGFCQSVDFLSGTSQSGYTSLYYAINRSIVEGGFDDNSTNILIVIGNSGDYRLEGDLKKAAIEARDPTYLDKKVIGNNVAKYKVRMFAVQCKNEGSEQNAFFAAHARALILEGAKSIYNNGYGSQTDATATNVRKTLSDNGFNAKEPFIPADEYQKKQFLDQTVVPGGLKALPTREILSPASGLKEAVLDINQESENYSKDYITTLSNVFDRGDELDFSSVDAGPAGPAMANLLYEMAKENKLPFSDLEKGVEEKYQLYHEVFFPRNVGGASNPSFSYILFMPKQDLRDYKELIKSCIKDSDSASPPERRKMLHEIYLELIAQFTGADDDQKERLKKGDIADLVAYMNGVEKEIKQEFKLKYNLPIADVLDKKKVSDETVQLLLNRFGEIYRFLDEEVLRKGEKYPFIYSSGEDNDYYWIPIEETF